MKKVLAVMLAALTAFSVVAQAASFPDMEDARWDWARETVEELVGKGIIKGYNDGTYKPENSVTNEEAFTLFARVIGVNDAKNAQAVADAQKLYADVADKYETYAKKELCFLLYRGILDTEDLDEYLALDVQDVPMKRHEAAKLITRILDGEQEVADAVMFVFDYTDADTFLNSAKGYISYVTEKGIMTGMGDGTFSPDMGVTRAQIAIMLKRTINMLAVKTVTGAAAAVNETGLSVDGEVYTVSEKTIVHKDGAAATIADIQNGDDVLLTLTYKGLLSIDAVTTAASEKDEEEKVPETTVVEGIYSGSYTEEGITYVKVYDKDGGVATVQSYKLAGKVSYIVNEEEKASLTFIKATDYVYLSIVGDEVVSIVAETKTLTVEAATVEAIAYENGVNLLTVAHSDKKFDGKQWPLSANVVVMRNKEDATPADLISGDTVKLTIVYGEITRITATSKTSTMMGDITEIFIAKTNPYVSVKATDGKIHKLYLTMDTVIMIDSQESTIYDLELDYEVKVTTESNSASRIAVTSVVRKNNVSGTVVEINESMGYITVRVYDAATDKTTDKQLFLSDKTNIRAGSTGSLVKIAALAEGDELFATGTEKVGLFEAATIIVVNK